MPGMDEGNWPTETQVRRWLRVREMLLWAATRSRPAHSIAGAFIDRPRVPGAPPPPPGFENRGISTGELEEIKARLASEVEARDLPVKPDDREFEALVCWWLHLSGVPVRAFSQERLPAPHVFKEYFFTIGSDTVVRSHMWLAIDSPQTETVKRRGFRPSWTAIAWLCDLVEEVCGGVVSGELDDASRLVEAFASTVRPLSRSVAQLARSGATTVDTEQGPCLDLDTYVTLVGNERIEAPALLRANGFDLRSVTLDGPVSLDSRTSVRLSRIKAGSLRVIRSQDAIDLELGTSLPSLTTLKAGGAVDIDLDYDAPAHSLRTIHCGGVLTITAAPFRHLPEDLEVGCHIYGSWVYSEELREEIDSWNRDNARCSCSIESATSLNDPL